MKLILDGITYSYTRNTPILQGVNLTLESGTVTALLGNNGSGKSTLLKVLTGVHRAHSGTVTLEGAEGRDLRRLTGYMPEQLQFYPDMSVEGVLLFFASLKGLNRSLIPGTLELVGLLEHKKKKVRALSKGMKQRLNFAQSIIGEPRILIFDEPSNGFDFSGIAIFYKVIRELKDKGAIVVLASHQLAEVSSHVDRITVLANGKLSWTGEMKELLTEFGEHRRQVWMCFDGDSSQIPLPEGALPGLRSVQHENDSIKGVLDGREVEEVIVAARKHGLGLRTIRVENSDLEQLLGGEG